VQYEYIRGKNKIERKEGRNLIFTYLISNKNLCLGREYEIDENIPSEKQ
jgi:hypothetical protein